MPCCKAKIYGWCQDLPVVEYKDKEGNEYCLFHAPKNTKGISLEEFNELVFKKIENEIDCDLSETIFEGDIDFKDKTLPAINFSQAYFSGEAFFMGTHFKGDAFFIGTVFGQNAHFSKAKFEGAADFALAQFESRTRFWDARFGGRADFGVSNFSKGADFSYAHFGGEANFRGTAFGVGGNTVFYRATFSRGADFVGKTFYNEGVLIELNIKEKIRFEGTDFTKISFLHTDLRLIDFINPIWRKKYGRNLLYDEIKLFKKSDKRDIETKNEEIIKNIFHGLKPWIRKEWECFKNNFFFNKEDIENVGILYRRLKQKYKEEHDQPEVSNWHYGEKEMFRKNNLWRRLLPSLSTLYWLSSGYGERPVRAGVMLLMIIGFVTFLFGIFGIEQLTISSPIDFKKGADISCLNNIKDLLLATLQYATFDKNPDFIPKTTNGKYLKIFTQIFIPLQMALFALAIRNRFRR